MQLYTQEMEVTKAHLDSNKHVNNIVYLQWMQEIAVKHSDACGWTAKRYYDSQCTWVAKNHFIDYIAPAFLGDVITAKTWIEDIKRSSSIRAYAFFNQHNKLIAKAQTTWVFIDTHTLRPKSILPEVKSAFEVLQNEFPQN